jgi:hypothetical protein
MRNYEKLSVDEANLVDRVAAQFGGYHDNGLKEELARLLLSVPKPR